MQVYYSPACSLDGTHRRVPYRLLKEAVLVIDACRLSTEQGAPVVYSYSAVLNWTVHGELACTFPDAPFDHLSISSQVPYLHTAQPQITSKQW